MSPLLGGRFFTTEPLEKPHFFLYKEYFWLHWVLVVARVIFIAESLFAACKLLVVACGI